MNNWLDKYEQGGMVLKQKTKDNYGKKANPNNPDVSLPPGFKGLAYNTKGRNYSPAWGGQFQMGGSLPGAVGFTYARTAGAAPSNGPYAKKTKASAQNGKEMKFYQAGLDFKPKTISQDGSEIPQAQMGTMATPLDFSKPLGTLEGVSEVMSAPARTATYLLTGKYQDPSQALGIKNPWGALAIDAVLDPVNLIGAGAVGKVGKAAKAAVKASKESGVLSKAHKLNPWAFKANPEAYYRGIGRAGLDDALESGVIRQKPKGGYSETYFTDKFPFATQYSRDQGYGVGNTLATDDSWYFVKPKDAQSYVAEIPKQNIKNAISNGGRNPFGYYSTNEPILTKDAKFYREHWLKGYKEVPKPKKKEDGGDIKKDDNGYWNPENWGEPVEIGSNEITMQGVYEPLLGISDTGDTQMMYPGEDYTFDGESVTEYPVAQKGLKVPSLNVSDPNDPRLKAYNDSLSIYNTASQQYKNIKKTGKLRDSDIDVDSEKKYSFKDYMDEYNRPNSDFNIFNSGTNSKMQPITVSQFRGKGILGYLDYGRQAQYKKPEQEVVYRKPEPTYVEKFGLTNDDIKRAFATKPIPKKDGDPYYNISKGGKNFRIHAQSGGLDYIEEIKPPKPSIKSQPKQEVVKKKEPTPQPVIQKEQHKPVERKQNIYEGSPVYSPGVGSGLGSALIGFLGQQGDTTYIKPEDYERFAVPKYGKEFIESKKKQRNGGVNKADEYPIEKLDQSLNFTNYNKPTKGGWLDKYN